MRFAYALMRDWPPLAWLARCSPTRPVVDVFHGPGVERTAEWFCEAVWAGAYETGGFDHTDVVFGSGGRLRNSTATFVSSGTTVDRLQSLETTDATWVSNSLPCLLAAVGGEPDPAYGAYFRDFGSIKHGLRRYRRTLATSAGRVALTYYHNLLWTDGRLVEAAKPAPTRDFSGYNRYRDFLAASLDALAQNLADPARACPYAMLGTISSGYDSPTVAALARACGLREAVSFATANDDAPDDGAAVAAVLGVRVRSLSRNAWRARDLGEVPFLAADAKGEDAYIGGAERLLRGRVLLTGFFGDKVWDPSGDGREGDLARHDQSGLALTEYRLWAGFIHCPVPYLGARQTRDIKAISRSPEMTPWAIPGRYSRPICRRIVEAAGVPREAFGIRKKAASVLFFVEPPGLGPDARADWGRWVAEHADAWRTRGRRPPRLTARPATWQVIAQVGSRPLRALAAAAPRGLGFLRPLADRVAGLARHAPSFRHVFPWALARMQQRYAAVSSTVDRA